MVAEGKYITAPVRNVVPKPLQRPHRRLGALTFSFASPEESRQWVRDYYTTLENECEPIGYDVNPQIAITCAFLCDRDEARVRELSAENHGFFMYGRGHYGFFGHHEPGKTNLWNDYKTKPVNFAPPEGRTQDCVGTPAQIRERLQEFEDVGLDQVIFLSQAGRIPHEILSSSIELFGKEVLPEVKERDQKREKERAALKARIVEKAMARKRKPVVPNWPPTVIRAAGHH